jgi:hypothetical protein
MTPLEMSKKAYDCLLTGEVPGLVALYSKDATFTPQMGLEGKTPLVTPKGTFTPAEMPGFFAALAEELEFTTWENRQFVADGAVMLSDIMLARTSGLGSRSRVSSRMFRHERMGSSLALRNLPTRRRYWLLKQSEEAWHFGE